MAKKLIALCIMLVSFTSLAQAKYEKEIRLKETLVPQVALDFVQSLSFSKKIKWYKEIGINTSSVEAKTKHLGKRYSVEFSMDGTLEDVEIQIKKEEIPENARLRITEYFTSKFGKYRINKIQIQYSGDPTVLLPFLKREKVSTEINTNYEIVVSARVNRAYKKFEFLFSEKGDYLKSAEIVLKNTDNIEY
ncbi:hypothetical protein POV27_08445 [Aureisphaera galaxeae]|uniref:hypothetical protein n=1 Tax=Aureisphaera galaxeae TaxID=1538023 RepID=UPI002350B64A|nr:hypothetical protein [Aureisphaera galaxeae]MDC8004080.1 hypothetical protein [Aureisphaera galaxeae]